MMKAAMDILFKPRVEATEQVTQNRTFRNLRINESAKSRLSDMYVVFVSCFHSILHLKTETSSAAFFDIGRMPQSVALKIYKEMYQVLLFAEFIL